MIGFAPVFFGTSPLLGKVNDIFSSNVDQVSVTFGGELALMVIAILLIIAGIKVISLFVNFIKGIFSKKKSFDTYVRAVMSNEVTNIGNKLEEINGRVTKLEHMEIPIRITELEIQLKVYTDSLRVGLSEIRNDIRSLRSRRSDDVDESRRVYKNYIIKEEE